MAENKTQITNVDVNMFINAVPHPVRRADAQIIDQMIRRITGWQPRMWGATIIGYGSYHYTYESGREGDSLACGFSPRKANQVLYIMPGYTNFDGILDRLGKYKKGKSCLYINKLSDIDLDVLEELLRAGLADLAATWPVQPT